MGKEAWLQVWGQALGGLCGKEGASDQMSKNLAVETQSCHLLALPVSPTVKWG